MLNENNKDDIFLDVAAREKTLLAEKHVSYIRGLVILLGTVTFLLMDKRYVITNLAYPLLIPIWIYGLWVIVFKSYRKYPIMRAAWFTFITDTIFAIVWIHATGGFYSPFYVMLYTSIISVAFRFSMKITFISSAINTICYFLLMQYNNSLQGNEAIISVRTGFIFIIGYFASLIIEETHAQVKAKHAAQSFKDELEGLVEERTAELEKSLQQVNTLLKEVHHRVKNNLQIISSLLNLQSDGENNNEVKEALLKSKNRILSIALIHQNLYGSENFGSIKAHDFIEQLAQNIKNSVEHDTNKITASIDVPDSLYFNMDTMTPLGLMINELLTNSYKYAFQNESSGTILVSIKPAGENQYILEYSDSGPGLPENIDLKNSETLGLGLVNILAGQLNGKMDYAKKPVNKFTVRFAIEAGKSAVPQEQIKKA